MPTGAMLRQDLVQQNTSCAKTWRILVIARTSRNVETTEEPYVCVALRIAMVFFEEDIVEDWKK